MENKVLFLIFILFLLVVLNNVYLINEWEINYGFNKSNTVNKLFITSENIKEGFQITESEVSQI